MNSYDSIIAGRSSTCLICNVRWKEKLNLVGEVNVVWEDDGYAAEAAAREVELFRENTK